MHPLKSKKCPELNIIHSRSIWQDSNYFVENLYSLANEQIEIKTLDINRSKIELSNTKLSKF